MVKLFVTGATGYIGGDALYALLKSRPDLEKNVSCLVRDSSRGAVVAKNYPGIRAVYGSLDDHVTLLKESCDADIVLNFADCDHAQAAEAITEGLKLRAAAGKPAYLIHTSGTGILEVDDLLRKSYGESSEKIYNDWDGINEVTSLPDAAWHREVDKIVLDAGTSSSVKTAIVCPPTIYGPGRGPGNKKSVQLYHMARIALHRGGGFRIGRGENRWTRIHVEDLSNLYLTLISAAIGPDDSIATWGKDGYYFCEAGTYVWGDIATKIAREAHEQGYLKTPDVDSITADEANTLFPTGAGQWGMNSRCSAVRARKLFGWEPKGKSIEEELAGIVRNEAIDLGLVKSHADMAAGTD